MPLGPDDDIYYIIYSISVTISHTQERAAAAETCATSPLMSLRCEELSGEELDAGSCNIILDFADHVAVL